MSQQLNLIADTVENLSIANFNVTIRHHQDLFRKKMFSLCSDIGDELGTFWQRQDGQWQKQLHEEFATVEELLDALEDEFKAKLIAKFCEFNRQIMMSGLSCKAITLPQKLTAEFTSIERCMLEAAILNLIQTMLSSLGVASTSKISDLLGEQCSIKLYTFTLNHSYSSQICHVKPEAIALKYDVFDAETNEFKSHSCSLKDLSDDSFTKITREIACQSILQDALEKVDIHAA